MNPEEAAAVLNRSARHIRLLCSRGRIRARLVWIPGGAGYMYDISEREINRLLHQSSSKKQRHQLTFPGRGKVKRRKETP